MATKFQQGGQDDQELFSAYLIKLFKPKSQQEFEGYYIQTLREGN